MGKRRDSFLLGVMLFGLVPMASASAIVNLDRVESNPFNSVSASEFPGSRQPLPFGADTPGQSAWGHDGVSGLPLIPILLSESFISPDLLQAINLTIPEPGVNTNLFSIRLECDGCAGIANGFVGGDGVGVAAVSAVPEPATLGMLAVGLAALGRRFRRSRA